MPQRWVDTEASFLIEPLLENSQISCGVEVVDYAGRLPHSAVGGSRRSMNQFGALTWVTEEPTDEAKKSPDAHVSNLERRESNVSERSAEEAHISRMKYYRTLCDSNILKVEVPPMHARNSWPPEHYLATTPLPLATNQGGQLVWGEYVMVQHGDGGAGDAVNPAPTNWFARICGRRRRVCVCMGSSWRMGLARIFTMVNVMLGSSLLVLPWAFAGSGLIPGTFLIFIVATFSHYTSSLIVKNSEGFDDFSDICLHYLGATAWHISLLSSLVVLIAALLAYHTLMSDFLHSLILELYPVATPAPPALSSDISNILLGLLQERMWTPLPLALILFPFTNVRDISQLARFTSYGIVAVFMSISFIVIVSLGLALDSIGQFGGLTFLLFAPPLPALSTTASALAPQASRPSTLPSRRLLTSRPLTTTELSTSSTDTTGKNDFLESSHTHEHSAPPHHAYPQKIQKNPWSRDSWSNHTKDVPSAVPYSGPVRVGLVGRKMGPLSSILPVSFFVHNLVIPMMRGPETMAVKMRHHATAFGLVASIYWLVGLVPVFAVAGAMQACLQFNSSLSCPLTVGCEWKPATAWLTTHSPPRPLVATQGTATRGNAPASAATGATESEGGEGGSGGSGWCVQEPIAQNFLMTKTKAWPDALTSLLLHGFVRLAVLLQLCTIFPLVCAVVRSQFFLYFLSTDYPGAVPVAFLNILLVSTSSVVAALFPNAPGEVLGYAGAISGTLYVCLLPILVHLAALHSRGQLTTSCIVMHALLIAIGSALFVHGFFVG